MLAFCAVDCTAWTLYFQCPVTHIAVRAVRYMLRGYLRVRLRKIEEYVMAILDDTDAMARLSEKERAFAQQYFRLFGVQMQDCLLMHLPE